MEQKKILIIDDDVAFSEMLAEILEEEGLQVTVAHDGQAGLAAALQMKPDLVMCDIMMPRMSGMEVVKQLRADTWGAAVPVILLTNMAQQEATAEMSDGSAPTECLLKTDWTLDQIATHIKELLAK